MRGLFAGRALFEPKRRASAFAASAFAAALLTAGCAQGGSGGSEEGTSGVEEAASGEPLSVVASTTQIADFVRNVGGEAVEEQQILQPNTDPHDYEPRPEDVRATSVAELVFVNGDDLDPWMESLVSESGSEAEVVTLSESIPERIEGDHAHEGEDQAHSDEHAHEGEEHAEEAHSEEEHAHDSEYDPHWWHDPNNAVAAVEEIRDRLAEADPENAEVYRRNAGEYVERLRTLDAEIEECIAGVPEEDRKLVTDHDSFEYFTERYGLRTVGAVIPSQTTQAQPSAQDTAELIRVIEEEDVQAIFPQETVGSNLADTVANETGATAEYTLYGDALGPEGSDGDTYLKMMSANADSIVRGLTGGEQGCETSVAG